MPPTFDAKTIHALCHALAPVVGEENADRLIPAQPSPMRHGAMLDRR